jgi:hypothetical protein
MMIWGGNAPHGEKGNFVKRVVNFLFRGSTPRLPSTISWLCQGGVILLQDVTAFFFSSHEHARQSRAIHQHLFTKTTQL